MGALMLHPSTPEQDQKTLREWLQARLMERFEGSAPETVIAAIFTALRSAPKVLSTEGLRHHALAAASRSLEQTLLREWLKGQLQQRFEQNGSKVDEATLHALRATPADRSNVAALRQYYLRAALTAMYTLMRVRKTEQVTTLTETGTPTGSASRQQFESAEQQLISAQRARLVWGVLERIRPREEIGAWILEQAELADAPFISDCFDAARAHFHVELSDQVLRRRHAYAKALFSREVTRLLAPEEAP
jgi:hypothetical protein